MENNIIGCGVVRDLLPLYAENMTGEESRALIEAHLAGCGDCRKEWQAIRASAKTARAAQNTEASLRRVRSRMNKRLRIALLATVAGLTLVFGVFVYGAIYSPPIRYEEGMISAGLFDHATGQFSETSGVWCVVNKHDRIVDYTRKVEYLDAEGNRQIWVFVHYKKDALWDRLFLNYGESIESDWISVSVLIPLEEIAEENAYARVFWVDEIKKFDQLAQTVDKAADRLTEDALALCTPIMESTVK